MVLHNCWESGSDAYSPLLCLNIVLERLMMDVFEEHSGTISIRGRMITNLQLSDDIAGLASKEEELTNLVHHLDSTSTAYGMEINAKKKLMVDKIEGIKRDTEVNSQRLEMINSFKYLGAIVTDEGSKPEDLSRITQASATLARLRIIWKDKTFLSNPKSD